MSHRAIDLKEWFNSQEQEFKEEVKDLKQYMSSPMSLKDLEEFDNKFINNSPEGGEK